MSNIEDEPPPVLLPCSICARTFKPEVLERHVKVCEKTATKKRRVFDSFRSRVSGTELEEFFGPAPLPGQVQKQPIKSPVKKRPSKWKETHENLIATLRAARGVEPLPETVMDAPKHAGNERCPSCSRFFGPRAFDRHVEFCKEKTARIKLTPSKVSQAQERLEARTKYRAPLSMKPKLTTKEKYSPMLTRKESVESCSVPPMKTSPPVPALSRSAKPGNFTRQSPIRSSERQRSVSPAKKSSVSSSKPPTKTEIKSHNQPKIKENLKAPGDLRPKTGSKASTQEKIRSSNPKLLPHLEDTTEKDLKKPITKTRKKFAAKHQIPSDSESIGTIDSEMNECFDKRHKWSSAESVRKEKPGRMKRSADETEKAVDSKDSEIIRAKGREETKSGKRSKQQKPQINDLSVNDESFGIFVAACGVSQPAVSKTSVRCNKDSPEKKVHKDAGKPRERVTPRSPKIEERKPTATGERRKRERVARKTPETAVETQDAGKIGKTIRTDGKVSKIPKPKSETACRVPPQKVIPDDEPETVSENFEAASETDLTPEIQPPEMSREEKLKKKSKKWRNITEIPTEDLMHMSEDLAGEKVEEFSESAIWDIAAEQFLQSEEPTHSTSAFSVDSLNDAEKKTRVGCTKNNPDGDDLIVLHVTDPSKLVEIDADMKLSISEPCFAYTDKVLKPKEKPPLGRKKVDIVVFTAFPNALQPRITHRKRRKPRKAKKLAPPEMSYIREKTFLANDIPKAKRRKLSHQKPAAIRGIEFGDCCFGTSSKKEMEETKKKFIEGLKTQREKIRKWQITADSHMRFMEEFEKSIEDDLRELKNLAMGKKTCRRLSLREFKREKMKRVKEEQEKMKEKEKQREKEPGKVKKFEYFEISLTDDDQSKECVESGRKEFECFEMATTPGRADKESEATPRRSGRKERANEIELTFSSPESVQTNTYQNSSLENIEEVDEGAENEDQVQSIEIEDFIVSKPDVGKMFSKGGNFLEELFPKPRKIAELQSSTESTTAVPLGFSADSVFDLKSKGNPGIAGRNRILQKRLTKESQLPQILVANSEQKENSMISLIEMWKNKKGSSGSGKTFKTKATLPTGKLPPLTNKNSFQIATDSDSYDPFKQAERQMLALLSWPSTVDIKNAKSSSPSPKPKPPSPHSNLQTSPTSAFTRYPGEKSAKRGGNNVRRNLNETFAMSENGRKNAETHTAADDWEQVFEKHFDLNRNEMLTEEMTRSVKSALDGILKSAMKKSEDGSSPDSNKNELTDSSIITEVLYTSTPKHSSKSDKSPTRSKTDQTPSTYRKNFTHGRVTPPNDFADLGREKKNDKTNRNSGISLSSLSFCSQISDTTLADEEIMRSNLEIIGKAAMAAAGKTPRRKYARSQSVFDERNKMLFAQTYDPNYSSSDDNDVEVPPKTNPKSPSRNPNPKSAPSRYYRSQSVVDDRCKGDGEQHSEDGGQASSPESNRNRKGKLSGDSAYSSLNRRSPRQNVQRNHHEDRLSSSGSEHSLPTTVNDCPPKPKSLDLENAQPSPKKGQPPVKMSKFCHECGSKYPVAVAKFCCECGVRRLII